MTILSNAFKRIRLNMARSKEFPQGSSRHGYEFVAARQHIDAELWKQHRDHFRVRRFGKARRMSAASWSTGRVSNEEGEMHTFRVVTLEPVT